MSARQQNAIETQTSARRENVVIETVIEIKAQEKIEQKEIEIQTSARKQSVYERSQQTSQRGQRNMGQQTDPNMRAGKTETNFQTEKSKKSITNQES